MESLLPEVVVFSFWVLRFGIVISGAPTNLNREHDCTFCLKRNSTVVTETDKRPYTDL